MATRTSAALLAALSICGCATPAMPPLNHPTTTLSNAQVAAFLSEVGTWYDRRTKAATAPESKPSSPHRASR